jgi:hypothetical protein
MAWEGLLPILEDAEARMTRVSAVARDPVEDGSALEGDDRKLKGWHLSTLAVSALNTAIEHVHAVKLLLVDAKAAPPHALLTLLRSALEDASLAVWLLAPDERQERLTRALRAWHRDFGDRAGFEKHERVQLRSKQWRSGTARQQQMIELATHLGLDAATVRKRLTATAVIDEATAAIGQRDDGLRLWSLSSGQAHGRLWAVMKNVPTDATRQKSNFAIRFVVDESNVIDLARIDHALILRADELLDERSRRRP